MRTCIAFMILTTMLAGPAAGAVTVTIEPAAEGAVVLVIPGAGGRGFDEAFGEDSDPVDATITLTITDDFGEPIVGVPRTEFMLGTSEGGLNICPGYGYPDHDTDSNGQTVWRNPLPAGGCTEGEVVVVFVGGEQVPGVALPLTFRSPDLSGDRTVNLADVVAFTVALGGGGGGCADFNNDGTVDLSDVVRMSAGIGMACQ